MAVSKEMMIEWLGEVPDGAEIGIEVGQRGQLDLIAFSGEDDQYILVVGGIPEARKKVNPQSRKATYPAPWWVKNLTTDDKEAVSQSSCPCPARSFNWVRTGRPMPRSAFWFVDWLDVP